MVVQILAIPFGCLGVLSGVYGFGKKIWDIGPDNLTKALRIFFFGELLYIPILGLCKISIVIFYLRIFPSPKFRVTCYIVIMWCVVNMVLIELLILFQCTPISFNWDGWKGESKGKCLDLSALTYAAAGANLAQDLTILLLPLPLLLKLQVSMKKKLGVFFMFSLGIFICITSIIRITNLVQFRATTNPTWDFVDAIFWTGIEVYVSIIVPCLPATRALLVNVFPKVFGSETQNQSRSRGSRREYKQQTPTPTPSPTEASFKMTSRSSRTDETNSNDHRISIQKLHLSLSSGTVGMSLTAISLESDKY
ncbi:hypothetical protein BP6252_13850 [Coleophoma cylindrospora]|uniref:Rhodopsin domain-containing protein n=1 Tax=Coleophoma cylindrospora TaxID=1849047 RepID=A0A3D8Q6R6_9HELO|nr:hypothetical protein BP6252_13850 [Coleophoma cylindrospora]